jgi:Ca2+ regulator and membrane fusion protein Fig1
MLFTFVSALWQHTSAASAAATMEVSGFGAIQAHIGSASAALVWLAMGLFAAAFLMVVFILVRMAVLQGLAD